MFKLFNSETEWDIFQNVIQLPHLTYTKSKKERILFEKIKECNWIDNTSTRPDFVSDNIMIEMFEIDDIVTKKRGKNNPQRKSDARALREVEEWLNQFPKEAFSENPLIIAQGDTRYNPENNTFIPDDSINHHNYEAYLNNFARICQKHLNNISDYRKNYPNKRLGFLIVDDATYYVTKKNMDGITTREAFLNLPFFDKNFMKMFIKSEVDFIIWAFNNKYFYTTEKKYGETGILPELVVISNDNYYTRYSKYFDISSMFSLEE